VDVRRVWLRVALAAGAGLASVAVCSGTVAIIVLLFIYATDLSIFGSSSASPLFYVGVVAATMVAWASLLLPPLALGARGGHVLKTTLLSGFCFCAFVFVSFMYLATASFAVPLVSLMALVGTPVLGSLGAILEEGRIAARPLRATLFAGSAIYCASLLTYFLVPDYWPSRFTPMVVAASSWTVVPGIVASLRPG